MVELKTPYKHYKNNKIYHTFEFCKIQLNGEWLEAVIYLDSDNKYYARQLSEFEQKFERVV